MSCSFSFQIPPALPSLSRSRCSSSLPVTSQHRHAINVKPEKISQKPTDYFHLKKSSLAIQVGAGLATIEQPAFAVTGINYEEDLTWVLIVRSCCLLPIIMNWLRIRWYRRNLLEMYFQFMFVFLSFPTLLLISRLRNEIKSESKNKVLKEK